MPQLLLELDPLSEDAVRGVMEARAWVGRSQHALKVYARFETRIADEWGAKPSPDCYGSRPASRGRRAAPRPAKAGRYRSAHERRFEAETLIGREREFAFPLRRVASGATSRAAYRRNSWRPRRGKDPRYQRVRGTCQMEGAAIAALKRTNAERELPFPCLLN